MMEAMSSRSRAEDDRLVDQVARACARVQEPLALLERVAGLVREHVPYEAAGWLLVDPEVLLITGVYEEGVPREAHLRLIELELSAEDVNKFVDLGRGGEPTASLSAATGGELRRSVRWSTVYEPLGLGDELRTVFRSGSVTWGHACLTRRADDPWFSRREVDVVSRLSPHVAHGIRTGLLLHEGWADGPDECPAVVVLDDAGRVESSTPQVHQWLGPVGDDRLESSIVVHEVATQVRLLTSDGVSGPPPVARARGRSGEWLLVRGARLDDPKGRTAVVLEPASRSDVAPVLLRLHELTPREREVTQLLLTGMATADVAGELCITTDTLRGHVKSVFGKLGVSSRPELFARLAHEPRVRSAEGGG